MRTIAVTLIALGLTAPTVSNSKSCEVGPWPSGVPEGSIELAEYPILDLALSKPDKPMPWGSVLAPADWTSSDGMRWSQRASCARNAQDSRWTLEAADGSVRISLLPQESWKIRPRWGDQGTASSCEMRSYMSADKFLLDLAGRLATSAREQTTRDRPDILASRSPEDARKAREEQFEEGISAAELRFRFTSNGGPRDAILISIVTVTGTAPFIPERDVHGSSAPSLFASFAAGQLDPRLVETIRRSFFFNSNWYWSQWQQQMRDAKIEPGDQKMRDAMVERMNEFRPVGKPRVLGGRAFTDTGIPDVWRSDAGRYFLFPEGAVPSTCTAP